MLKSMKYSIAMLALIKVGVVQVEAASASNQATEFKPIYCKIIRTRNAPSFQVPYAEYVSTVISDPEKDSKYHKIYSVQKIADERFRKSQRGLVDLSLCTKPTSSGRSYSSGRQRTITTIDNFRVIVEYSNFARTDQKPVLASVNTCSNSPTIYLMGTDQLNSGGGDGKYFSGKFYTSNSIIPRDKSDFGKRYRNLFNGHGSLDQPVLNYENILPHQFYARTNYVDLVTKNLRTYKQTTKLPDATESGIVRGLRAIYKKCQKLPNVVKIEGIMKVRYYDSGWTYLLKTFFKGTYTPNDSEFKILPDPAYRGVAGLFSKTYENSKKNQEAFYARMNSRRRPSGTATAIAGAAALGLLAIIVGN